MKAISFIKTTYAIPSQSLRLIYEGKVYTFRLLHPETLTEQCERVEVYLEGRVQILVRKHRLWYFRTIPDGGDVGLAQTIWWALSSSYLL